VLKQGFSSAIPVLLCVLLMGVGLNARRIGRWIDQDVAEDPLLPAEKTYTHAVAEGLSVQCGALPGVELVRFASCRIEKQYKGGFSFGAFNILIIDKLKITLPSEPTRALVGQAHNPRKSGENLMEGLLERDFHRLLSRYPQFSALEINGLSVEVAGPGSKLKNVLKAEKAVAGRKHTLKLLNCEFLAESGERLQCRSASLSLKPPFRIMTKNGSFRIEGFAGGHGFVPTQLTDNKKRSGGNEKDS